MTKNRIVAAVLSLSLVGTGAATALAQTDTPTTDRATDQASDRATDHVVDIARIKARAQEAIDNRLQRVARLQEGIDKHKEHLSENHYGQLNSKLATTEAGLEQLSRKIEDATTPAELRELVPQIWEDFRVYVLLTPQVKLVVASDMAVFGGEKANEIVARLGEAITKAEEAGYDVGEAPKLLETLKTNVAAAVAAADPVAESVLPLTPEDWNNGSAQPVLEAGKAGIRSAHESFVQARENAHEIVRILKGLRNTATGTDS